MILGFRTSLFEISKLDISKINIIILISILRYFKSVRDLYNQFKTLKSVLSGKFGVICIK